MKVNFPLLIFLLSMTLSSSAVGSVVDSIAAPKKWLEQQDSIGKVLLGSSKDYDKTAKFFKNVHEFAVSKNLSDQFVNISIGYGVAMYKNGEIQNSYKLLLEMLPKIDNSNLKLKAKISKVLGMTLVFQDKFSEGYKFQMDALKYYSDIKDSTGQMAVYYDIGSNFDTQGQSELALKNYEKGIAIAKAIDNPKMTILGITYLGSAWASLKNYEKALKYSSESIELANLLKDDEELAWASINRGHILGKIDDLEEAEFYLQQAYDLSFVIGNKLLSAYALEQMSDVFIKQNRIQEAIKSLDESYENYQDLGMINSIKEVTKKYADIYFIQKDFLKYKEYTDKYITLKDSLYSKEMVESMASLKQDFEIHQLERENQIALLTKDKELTKVKNFNAIVITSGAILIFAMLLFLMYSRNKAAVEKNEILTAKNAEILRQNEFLVNSNQDLEKFAYIISHDLKEPLRNINGFTNLLNRKLKLYQLDNDIKDYSSFITNSTKQMEALLTGLLEYSKLSVNKREKEDSDLNKVVYGVLDNLKIQISEKNCEIDIQELPTLPCRTTQLTQVFQNLIANALKFGPEKGNKISIGVEDNMCSYQFYVKDSGIGIEEEYQKDIFVVFKRLHNRGTYSGSGIGLATCKKVVEDHGGRIWVESELGQGATFFFTLPKNPDPELIAGCDEQKEEQTSHLEIV